MSLSISNSGYRRTARQRDPTAQAGHADAASSQGCTAVRAVRLGSRAAAVGPRVSGTKLTPSGDHVPRRDSALQPGRKEEAQEDDPSSAHERHRVVQR